MMKIKKIIQKKESFSEEENRANKITRTSKNFIL